MSAVTITPTGEITHTVRLDGVVVGEIYGDATRACAQPAGARLGTYRFAGLQAAAAACVAYATVGYWTGEIS